MFIEVTREGKKILLNTDEIVMVSAYRVTGGNKEFTIVTLAHPHVIMGGIGVIKLVLEEPYDQIKMLL